MPMKVSRTDAHLAAASNGQWLLVDQSREERVTVAVVGGLMADRAEELWSSVEYALEVADGRPVTVDLTAVTGFDHNTVEAVKDVIRTAARRRDDVEIRLVAGSALDQYTRSYGLVHNGVGGTTPEAGK
jgi:ABC-type transporter Mla MlaB component